MSLINHSHMSMSTVQLSHFVSIRESYGQVSQMEFKYGVTQKESALDTVWKSGGVSSLVKHSNSTAVFVHFQISINNLPSTIRSREVPSFPRRKEI